VPSAAGATVQSLKRGATRLRAGKGARVATLRLAQPLDVEARVVRGKKVVATLFRRCLSAGKDHTVRWRARIGAKRAKAGAYGVQLVIRSDRKSDLRRLAVTVRPK
jgi:hypothetical protein